MTGLGVGVAFLLLLWCSLLYLPFRCRLAGIYLVAEMGLAVAYVPFIAVGGVALAVAGAMFGSWWITVPAGVAALGATVVIAPVGPPADVPSSGVAVVCGWSNVVVVRIMRAHMLAALKRNVERPMKCTGVLGGVLGGVA